MRAQGLTQSALAEKMGVSKQYISHLMTGHRNPGLDSLEKAATALGVEASWLISGKSEV